MTDETHFQKNHSPALPWRRLDDRILGHRFWSSSAGHEWLVLEEREVILLGNTVTSFLWESLDYESCWPRKTETSLPQRLWVIPKGSSFLPSQMEMQVKVGQLPFKRKERRKSNPSFKLINIKQGLCSFFFFPTWRSGLAKGSGV